MRNLSLLHRTSCQFDGVEFEARLLVQDETRRDVAIAVDGNVVKSLNRVTGESKDLCIHEDIIAMEYVQLNDCLCLATKSGEIIQFSFVDESSEVVGLIADGIETMTWSPDQELVVFVTRSQNVVLMFSTFDVLNESSLSETAAKEFITVGWGKKDTQFHGSAGKDGRKKEIETKEALTARIDNLDKTITCCWRGDGEFFAVNFVGDNGRMFKVFTKEGSLQYTSELCAQLEIPMAWRPSGLWIAKPEILPNKYVVTLFERNGLKHNELVLPFTADTEQVKSLSWNQDSDIFLIETTRGSTHFLYFYTICNYHWYLKYTLEFNETLVYRWSQDFTEPKVLHLITSSGNFQSLKFGFQVASSEESIVGVIDGRKLLLTNFKHQMVPPPMASLEVPLEKPANLISFLKCAGEDFDCNSFVTLDHDNVVKFYRCLINGKLSGVEIAKELKLEVDSIVDLIWISQEHLVASEGSKISLFSVDSGALVSEVFLEDVIGGLAYKADNEIVAQLIDGTLVHLEISSSVISIVEHLEKFPEFCGTFIAVENSVFGHKHIGKRLYRNSQELATEVTSFAMTSDNQQLLFTTIGELKFLDQQLQIVDSRRVERGSKIVTLVKDKSQVVFQLPRGNLETISPRILSLKIIKKFLGHREYCKVLDLLRKERINLNLIVDLDPGKFLEDLATFVEQIDNIQWLNLFLTELKDEDVTKTMYKFCGDIPESRIESWPTNKVTLLCEKFLNLFATFDAQKFILPSITCHVKNQNIETALQLIWELKLSGEPADDALKYLLYLIDINSLYNIALGMYDFQLVLYVAQKSQKDPKEFVPFLNELSKMEPAYARFKIDCHLKRFDKAVKHISELPEKFDECVELVKRHSLYQQALEAYKSNEILYKRLCVLFGDYLRERGRFIDASLMYQRGGDFQQALSGARNILDWRRCLKLGDASEIWEKLCHSLKETGRFREASELVRKFAPQDKHQLVEFLLKARKYSDAILEADDELLETFVKPQVKQQLQDIVKSIDEDQQLYLDQKHRLLLLREEKLRKIQNPQEDDDETFSDTSSINSQSSKNSTRTFRSSKNKRKHERKLMNLKEGNKFEDIALLDAIWKLVSKIISVENQNAIRDLLLTAVELEADDDGRLLQKSYKNLLLLLKNTMDEIWIPEMLSAGKYPETEEEMMQINLDSGLSSKTSYELIKPEQRFKPKLNVIDFEVELYRESSTKTRSGTQVS